jgi:hypothetical protein
VSLFFLNHEKKENMNSPSHVTMAAFARLIGHDRSHVTRLRQAERIVCTGSGRATLVDVAASIALIKQTSGLRDDVAARHASARPAPMGQGGESPRTQPAAPGSANVAASPDTPPEAPLGIMEQARRDKLLAESRRVQASADREEMERDKLAGDLIAREDVDAAMKFVGATVRSEMEILPDQLAPLVVPITSIEEAHTLIAEAGSNILVRLGEAIERQQAALARHT